MSSKERSASVARPRLRPEARELGVLARRYFAHDLEGQTHAGNVALLAVRIALQFGLPRPDLIALAVGATLHDIGKLAVPAAVLETPGELSSDEWDLVRTHPACGDVLVSSHLRHPIVRSVIRWHHERVDGGGYPDGLCYEEIPLPARIVAVADAYETQLAGRPYSEPRSPFDALAELVDCAGSQFDVGCVGRLAEIARSSTCNAGSTLPRYVP